MEGIVEIFELKEDGWGKIYEDPNMVVHGGKTACVDIFTHVPYEFSDGTTPDASSVYQSVSNYTIQSMTLGAGTRTMAKRDSRHAVVKENDLDGTGSTDAHQYLDVSGKYYSLLPYRENWNFSSFGSRGLYKTPAKPKKLPHPGKKFPPSILDSNILEYGRIGISKTDEDGGSLVFTKKLGQDYAIVEIPVDLHLQTKYKLSLGVEGELPAKLEVVRVDKITRDNSLSVDLREQVWDFSLDRFVYEYEESDKDKLSTLLYASSVIAGELTETTITTAFDRVDEGKRVELFDYKVRITVPQATDFQKGTVRLHSFKIESQDDIILKNPNFEDIESLVTNTSFKDLSPYNLRAPNSEANVDELKVMGVYQIGGWEHQSPLYTSANPLWESLQPSCLVGWISLDNVDSYGTSAVPPRVLDQDESNIGVCFNSCALGFDWSGTAQLTKRFKYPKAWTNYYTHSGSRFERGFLSDPYSWRSLTIKFDAIPVSSADVTPDEMMGVKIRCKNVTRDLYYNFVAGVGFDAHSWGGSGTPVLLGEGLAMGTSTTLQTNIQMPLDYYNDEFKLDIIGHAGNANWVRGKLILKNLDIGQWRGWNVHEAFASATTVSACEGRPVSGINIITPASPPANWYTLSSIEKNTFISQTITGLDPKKVYNLIVEGKSNVGTGALGVALVHKGFSDPYNFNYAKYYTLGPAYNAGNVYFSHFNVDTCLSSLIFNMPGPAGTRDATQSDLRFQRHQKCVRWNLPASGVDSGHTLYRFTSESHPSSLHTHNMHVSLPPGRFKYEMDLRHICDAPFLAQQTNPYGYFAPVNLGMRIPTGQLSNTGEAFWYNFKTRKWDLVRDSETLVDKPEYRHRILPGSHHKKFNGSEQFPNIAKDSVSIHDLDGEPDGWTKAAVSFDIRNQDFNSMCPLGENKNEFHIDHTKWGTRDVEFVVHADFNVDVPHGNTPYGNVLNSVEPKGTVFIKNFSLTGPSPFREPLNTYYVYKGAGNWAATSSLSSVEVFGDSNTGARTGHRPRRDVSAGVDTWNELGGGFATTVSLSDVQQAFTIYGMDKFKLPDFSNRPYGSSYLGDGEVLTSSMRMACEDSVYELILFHTGGTNVEIHNVTLTDVATQFNDSPDIINTTGWTSEPEVSPPRLAFPGGWTTAFQNVTYTNPDNFYQNRSTQPPEVVTYASGGQSDLTTLRTRQQQGDYKTSDSDAYHATIHSYCDTLENFKMLASKRYAFSFDYLNGGAQASAAVFLDKVEGDHLLWLSGTGDNTIWVHGDRNNVSNGTSYGAGDGGCWVGLDDHNKIAGSMQYVKDLTRDYVSPEFKIPGGIPEGARIGVLVRILPTVTGFVNALGNVKAYEVIHPDVVSSVMPDFPQEQDSMVQLPTEANTPGEYGHFQNMIEFFPSGTAWDYNASTTEHIPTYEKAVGLGAYLPGSGIVFSAGTFGYNGAEANKWNSTVSSISGTLNQYSTITPKGHILRNYNADRQVGQTSLIGGEDKDDWIFETSAGLCVSGPMPESGLEGDINTRIVKYGLTLTKEEFEYLNFYGGGIESAGLWTIDGPRSAKKLDTEYGGPPYLVSGTGTPYTGSIYNLKDYIEPDWDLFAKKIFFAGGLQMDPDSKYLTIIWSLKF